MRVIPEHRRDRDPPVMRVVRVSDSGTVFVESPGEDGEIRESMTCFLPGRYVIEHLPLGEEELILPWLMAELTR